VTVSAAQYSSKKTMLVEKYFFAINFLKIINTKKHWLATLVIAGSDVSSP